MCHRHGPQESPGTEVLKKRFLFADCYVCQTACCLLQCSAQDSIAMPATFDTVAACSSWKWRKRCHITMHGKIQNPRIHGGLSGICMYRLSMMCHRHGPQESPGTEVLKKRFLFADCYVCQTACCLLQCSAQDSIAMPATFDTAAACSSWKWRKRCHITMHGKIQNDCYVCQTACCLLQCSAQDSIAMPATFDTVAACSSWKWRKRCHITMHGKIPNPRIHGGLSGICMYRLSMMCHRHGPQESPGTEVLKKRFLFADCYVCQTACCLLQCSAQDSIAMPATFDTVAACSSLKWRKRCHITMHEKSKDV